MALGLRTVIRKAAVRLGLAPPPETRPAGPGWSGNGMVATLNGTGFMFEKTDAFAEAFVRCAGDVAPRPVLEIGCAYGVATIPALEAGGHVVACDMEPGHLDILRDKVPPKLRPRLELVAGQLPDIDFEPGRFAALLCSRVLHFLEGEDIDTSVRKMFEWLAPGGRLFLVADTPYGIWRKKIPDFEAGKQRGERWPGMMVGLHNWLATGPPAKPILRPPFMNLLDPELLSRTCTEAGFEVQQASFIARPDFGGLGSLDGRENAGVIAVKPR